MAFPSEMARRLRVTVSGTAPRLLALLAFALGSQVALGQELEARAYAPNPVGARFLVLSYSRFDGDMLLNASSPIKDFEVRADTYSAGIGGTFALANRLASLAIAVPYVDGTATAVVNGVPDRADREGLGDLRLRMTLSLLPGSAQSMAEFTRAPPDRTLGVSLVVNVPTGEYFDDKLINLSTNRWAFKPEFGGSRRFGRWNVDGSLGVWLYGDTGGTTSVDGVSDHNRQGNSRAGLTLAIPAGQQNSVKLAWSKGVTARFGGDLDMYSLT